MGAETKDSATTHSLLPLRPEDYQPERLIRELRDRYVLLLGTRLPDWIGRQFIRLVRGQRLTETGGSIEALADSLVVAPGAPAPLVAFLDTFSQNTRLYRLGDAEHFVAEFYHRWSNRQPPPIPPPAPSITSPPSDLAGAGCFISYIRKDATAATTLYKALAEAGIPVWLDLAEMLGGERFGDKIRRNLEGAKFFLALLSANTSGQSGYFRREWNWAIVHNEKFLALRENHHRYHLCPIILDDTPIEAFKDLPPDFAEVHIEVCRDGKPTDKFLAQLLAAHGLPIPPGSAS
jgi:hypothetical protein